MKICVYFQPKSELDNFEGTRLRKNIKGALELRNIPYAKNIVDSYNIIHFCSLDDEVKILDAKECGIPIVFTAMMCETDPTTRIFEYKNGEYVIDLRATRVLNKVDLILVSDEYSKDLLIKNGITTKIEIVPIGVKVTRFTMRYGIEDNLFNKFFQIEYGRKYIISIGNYEDKDKFDSLIRIAAACPKYDFFYFGFTKKNKVKYKNKAIPSNLRFYPLIDDEIYCSMMKNASIYLAFDNKRHSPITFMDAAASTTQIVALEPTGPNKDVLEKMKAFICKSEEKVISTIEKLMNNDIVWHCGEALQIANDNSLDKLGRSLENIYEELLKEKNHD